MAMAWSASVSFLFCLRSVGNLGKVTTRSSFTFDPYKQTQCCTFTFSVLVAKFYLWCKLYYYFPCFQMSLVPLVVPIEFYRAKGLKS